MLKTKIFSSKYAIDVENAVNNWLKEHPEYRIDYISYTATDLLLSAMILYEVK